MAVFNNRGDQPDHALRAARAALELQTRSAGLAERHPDWPGLRVGVNSGRVVVREVGSHGHVAYPSVGDTVNVGSRLEGLAPAGGVLIGEETYARIRKDRYAVSTTDAEGAWTFHARGPVDDGAVFVEVLEGITDQFFKALAMSPRAGLQPLLHVVFKVPHD